MSKEINVDYDEANALLVDCMGMLQDSASNYSDEWKTTSCMESGMSGINKAVGALASANSTFRGYLQSIKQTASTPQPSVPIPSSPTPSHGEIPSPDSFS